MDEDTTDAAWAQQELEERLQREEAALKSARPKAEELKRLIRESHDLFFKSRQAPHNERS